jgi:hypothetical protein
MIHGCPIVSKVINTICWIVTMMMVGVMATDLFSIAELKFYGNNIVTATHVIVDAKLKSRTLSLWFAVCGFFRRCLRGSSNSWVTVSVLRDHITSHLPGDCSRVGRHFRP